ncbi:MFS transporter [Jatrophihabitans fulvus]
MLTAGVIAFALLQSFVVPVLPTLERALGTSASGGSWILTAYLLSASVATPIVGRIGDVVGKKPVLVAALVTLGAGSALGAVAPNLTVMIVARLVQGIGGGVLPLSFGIVRDRWDAHAVPRVIGALSALAGAAAGLGTVAAGPVVAALGHAWLFWLPGIIVALAAFAGWRFIPRDRQPAAGGGGIGWWPAMMLSGWLTALLVALSEGSRWGWTSPATLGLLGAALVLVAAWIAVEAHVRVPLIDLAVMRRRAVWAANLVTMLMGAAIYASFAAVPAFLQVPTGYGPGVSITLAGLIMLPSAAVTFVMGLASAPLVRRFGPKPVVGLALGSSALGFVGLAFRHDSVAAICVSTCLYGLGFGLAFAALSALIVEAVPLSHTGVASGMNANIRTLGGALGAAVVAGTLAAATTRAGYPVESAYRDAFVLLAVVCVGATLAVALIPSHSRSEGPDGADRGDSANRIDGVADSHPVLGMVAGGTVVGDGYERAPKAPRAASDAHLADE